MRGVTIAVVGQLRIAGSSVSQGGPVGNSCEGIQEVPVLVGRACRDPWTAGAEKGRDGPSQSGYGTTAGRSPTVA